jgi:hypothetical protein
MFLKKVILGLSLVFLISTYGAAATTTDDFRRTRWGMNRNEVIATEGAPQGETENAIMYLNIPFAGYSSRLIYVFGDNQLMEAFYSIPAGTEDLSVRFNKIKSIISVKYGAPPAASTGEACIWNTPRSQVILMIDQKYGEMVVAYRDRSVPISDNDVVAI